MSARIRPVTSVGRTDELSQGVDAPVSRVGRVGLAPGPALRRAPPASPRPRSMMRNARSAADYERADLDDRLSSAGSSCSNSSSACRTTRPLWRRLLSTIGPGLMTCMADTDGPCLITAALSGAQWRYSLLLLQIGLVPILFIAQELAVRLGIVRPTRLGMSGGGSSGAVPLRFDQRGCLAPPPCPAKPHRNPASRCAAHGPRLACAQLANSLVALTAVQDHARVRLSIPAAPKWLPPCNASHQPRLWDFRIAIQAR